MFKIAFFLFVLANLSSFIFAQEFDKQKMDRFFDNLADNQAGMGSVSIFKNGQELYAKSTGFIDVKEQQKADASSLYRIGSISKTYTATMIMQLIEEGKLELTTPLAQFFPELPNADEITVEQLLRHRSGLFNFTNKEDYTQWMIRPFSREELLKMFEELGTVFEPDERAEYSNTNYVLLGWIVEDLDSKIYEHSLQDRILNIVGTSTTQVLAKISSDSNAAKSYDKYRKWELSTETDITVPGGAGAISSNASDLNKFYNALYSGQLVSVNALSEMKRLKENYGIGMFKIPFHDNIGYGHTGGIDGFQSMSIYFPKDSVTITYLSNAVDYPLNDVIIGALSIFYGKEYEIPNFVSDYNIKVKKLHQYAGLYGSDDFPLDLDVKVIHDCLTIQATGQPIAVVTPLRRNTFEYKAAGAVIEFNTKNNELKLTQFGSVHNLKKK